MSKSKNKGSAYERKIAKEMSEAFGTEFKRCPGSGAIGTMNNIPGLQGDIIRADLKPIPYIECKKYKDFRIEHFLIQSGNEWMWVKQTLTNIQEGRKWVIVFQKDFGRQSWVLTNIELCIFPKAIIQFADMDLYLSIFSDILLDANIRQEFM